MIKSMTGFGSNTQTTATESISVEIKTLNSKFLDLAYKAPRMLSDKEIEIRNIITKSLVRGKINFSIQLESTQSNLRGVQINEDLFLQYLEKYKSLEDSTGRKFSDIMRLSLESPDVSQNIEESISTESWASIIKAIESAIESCNSSREDEGSKLSEVLSGYIESIRASLKEIKLIEPKRLNKLKEKLRVQIEELMHNKEFETDRLEQELIFYSEKLDINEEIERLGIHLDSYQSVLKDKHENQHGKKLGFISQEIGREINTIGSKANDADIQKYVILMKEELEKIKEQTLNIL